MKSHEIVNTLLESENLSAKAFEAIKDWQQSTGAMWIDGPFFARQFEDGGTVIFEVKPWMEGLSLSFIKTAPDQRGKGYASRALKELLSYADKHGVPVTGGVSRQKDEGATLTNQQLMAWYKRHGFQKSYGTQIKRMPQPPKP